MCPSKLFKVTHFTGFTALLRQHNLTCFGFLLPSVQTYSTNSMGYYTGKRGALSYNPLLAKVACTPHRNGKSSSPDEAGLTGEQCVIIGESLYTPLAGCVRCFAWALEHVCSSVRWHFSLWANTAITEASRLIWKHQRGGKFYEYIKDSAENGSLSLTKHDLYFTSVVTTQNVTSLFLFTIRL